MTAQTPHSKRCAARPSPAQSRRPFVEVARQDRRTDSADVVRYLDIKDASLSTGWACGTLYGWLEQGLIEHSHRGPRQRRVRVAVDSQGETINARRPCSVCHRRRRQTNTDRRKRR